MPNIDMCGSAKCPLAPECRRHADSGVVPSKRQKYIDFGEIVVPGPGIAVVCHGFRRRYLLWRAMDTAPRDRPILVMTDSRDGLPNFVTTATWHPDAGFTVDEFREPVLWREIKL